MKGVLKFFAGLLLIAYIVFAVVKWSSKEDTDMCSRVTIAVVDSAKAAFIGVKDVQTLLERKHLYPEGMPMNKIDLSEIEQALQSHPFILEAQCYKTPTGTMHIDVSQRLPVMRILSADSKSKMKDYFIDGQGKPLKQVDYPADVVVATGHISQQYAEQCLAPIGRYLQKNDFWNSQIEQIHVLSDTTVELVPRVGNHVIYLGSAADFEKKLARLTVFYKKVLNEVGWNKYSRINLEYDNQIVCTKSE
jgi:cell division protein FtsQ